METPRCTRIRRRFGPNGHSLMARALPQECYQRPQRGGGGQRGPAAARYVPFLYIRLRIWRAERTEGRGGKRVQHGGTGKRGPNGEDKCLLFLASSSPFFSPLLCFSVLMS